MYNLFKFAFTTELCVWNLNDRVCVCFSHFCFVSFRSVSSLLWHFTKLFADNSHTKTALCSLSENGESSSDSDKLLRITFPSHIPTNKIQYIPYFLNIPRLLVTIHTHTHRIARRESPEIVFSGCPPFHRLVQRTTKYILVPHGKCIVYLPWAVWIPTSPRVLSWRHNKNTTHTQTQTPNKGGRNRRAAWELMTPASAHVWRWRTTIKHRPCPDVWCDWRHRWWITFNRWTPPIGERQRNNNTYR